MANKESKEVQNREKLKKEEKGNDVGREVRPGEEITEREGEGREKTGGMKEGEIEQTIEVLDKTDGVTDVGSSSVIASISIAEPMLSPGLALGSRDNINEPGCRDGRSKGVDSAASDRITSQKGQRKYRKHMQVLNPVRFRPKNEEYSPLDHCGLFSFLWMSWLSPVFYKAFRRTLQHADLHAFSNDDKGEPNGLRFERLWREEVGRNGAEDASLLRVVGRFILSRQIFAAFSLLMATMSIFIVSTVLVKKILQYSESPEADIRYGITLVVCILVLAIVKICFDVTFATVACRTATRLRSGILALTFKRLAHLRSLKEHTVGEIVNVCANDGQRLNEACIISNFLVNSVMMCFAVLFVTYFIVGPGALIGTTATFVLFLPLQAWIGKKIAVFRMKSIGSTDRRVQKTNEVLTYIKLIKMYAWEKPFAKTIAGIRSLERRMLEKAGLVQSYSVSIIPVVPNIAAVVSILIHVVLGNKLTASEAFTLISMLNVMRIVIAPLPFAIRLLGESHVALARIKKILILDVVEPNPELRDCSENLVEITNGTFGWDVVKGEKEKGGEKNEQGINGRSSSKQKKNGSNIRMEKNDVQENLMPKANSSNCQQEGIIYDSSKVCPVIFNINFQLKRGSLTGICGLVGSGKTSLISAILGQMQTVEGICCVAGRFAYVAQEAWIFNGTVEENILFGKEMDLERYENVLRVCSLKQDLDILPDGDKTEIGERGINLSGGQKQRISLARAVYANCDVYLLDDPLSAVDAHVGEHIFTQCILGTLGEKTVLFVTHQLQYLQDCDTIVVMYEGRIAEQGVHKDLKEKGGEYARLISSHYISVEQEGDEGMNEKESKEHLCQETVPSIAESEKSCSTSSLYEGGKLTTAEEQDIGSILSTVNGYIMAMGGYQYAVIILLAFAVMIALLTFNNWWLVIWIEASSKMNATLNGTDGELVLSSEQLDYYMMIYGLLILIVLAVAGLKSFVFMKLSLKASSTLLQKLYNKVMRCPMSFFDTTPTGRILNRFSKDIDELDVPLPVHLHLVLMNALMMISALVTVAIVFPFFLIVVVPVIAIFCFIYRVYRNGLKGLKQLDNVSRSPWFSHIASTASGLSTLHAYGKTNEVITKFIELLDVNSHPVMLFWMGTRWVGARMEMLVVLIITVTCLMIVLYHGRIPPAMAGLAISYTMQLTSLMQFTVHMMADAEARFVSVDRILQYIKSLESEAPQQTSSDKKLAMGWPKDGAIQFSEYKMRYRSNLPFVLKKVGFNVEAGERIGIIGRTGSGKSSLSVALFRLVEATDGCITIDGVNIADIGLGTLRSKISIIPQDPVLFIGTVRYNLDPFNEHDDETLWDALERAYMKPKIGSTVGGLEAPVTEGGDNFSVGERQLLCMARAMLRNCKILFLDEATAAIDTETDSLIQETIRSVFSDCTTLTIAHRLNTVLDSDRILVMDDGQIAEFDTPSNLRSNPNSILSGMIAAAEAQNNR